MVDALEIRAFGCFEAFCIIFYTSLTFLFICRKITTILYNDPIAGINNSLPEYFIKKGLGTYHFGGKL